MNSADIRKILLGRGEAHTVRIFTMDSPTPTEVRLSLGYTIDARATYVKITGQSPLSQVSDGYISNKKDEVKETIYIFYDKIVSIVLVEKL